MKIRDEKALALLGRHASSEKSKWQRGYMFLHCREEKYKKKKISRGHVDMASRLPSASMRVPAYCAHQTLNAWRAITLPARVGASLFALAAMHNVRCSSISRCKAKSSASPRRVRACAPAARVLSAWRKSEMLSWLSNKRNILKNEKKVKIVSIGVIWLA